jgi:hypothetical protein
VDSFNMNARKIRKLMNLKNREDDGSIMILKTVLKAVRLPLIIGICLTIETETFAATIEIGSTNVQSGTTFWVPVTVDSGTSPLGLIEMNIAYDSTVLQAVSASGVGAFPGTLVNTNNSGVVRLFGVNTLSLTSPTGLVTVAQVEFKAIGASGTSSALSLNSVGLGDTDGIYFVVVAVDGLVMVGARTVEQLAPCTGPPGGARWRSHGEYLQAVRDASEFLVNSGLMSNDGSGNAECFEPSRTIRLREGRKLGAEKQH